MKRIGELLVDSGCVTEEQVLEALKIQQEGKKKRKKHKRLGEILIALDYTTSHDLIKMLSQQAAIPFVELKQEILDEKLIKSFPERVLYDNIVIPLYEKRSEISVATGDPTNQSVVHELSKYTKKAIVLSGADTAQIIQLLNKYFLIDQAEKILGKS